MNEDRNRKLIWSGIGYTALGCGLPFVLVDWFQSGRVKGGSLMAPLYLLVDPKNMAFLRETSPIAFWITLSAGLLAAVYAGFEGITRLHKYFRQAGGAN